MSDAAVAAAAAREALMPTVRLVYGPIVLGSIFNGFAHGLTAMQYYQYFTSGFKDHWLIVSMVTWLATMDVWFAINAFMLVWDTLIEGYLDATRIGSTTWNINLLSIFTTICIYMFFSFFFSPANSSSRTALPVQIFLANRIRMFSKSWALFVFLVAASLATAGTAWAVSILMQTNIDSGLAARNRLVQIAVVWLSMSVGLDSTLTLLMVFFLYRSRSQFQRTNKIIAKYIVLSFQSGLPVTICAALILATTEEFLLSNISIVFSFLLGRMYAMTFLTTLNTRKTLRAGTEMPSGRSQPYNSVNEINLKALSPNRRPEVNVSVSQNVIHDTIPDDDKSWPTQSKPVAL